MADIAMCRRRDCTKKNTCFRYLAFPDEYQSYMAVQQQDLSEGCDMYWRCRNRKELQLLNKLNQ